jgi:succinate-acetate transporter protein
VVPLAFAYGGVAQIIAGILEFRTGNTFGMVAFTSYGLFWWWFAFLQWTIGAGWLKAPPASAVAVTLLAWGIFTFLFWIVTFRSNKAVWSIFLLLWITFFLLALGDFGLSLGSLRLGVLGGWLGLLTGIDALLVAFIEVLNATSGRTVIPLGDPILRQN